MAENIIGFVILFICAIPLIVIGITQMKSKEPVGFWSGVKPPSRDEVLDVPTYNKKHGSHPWDCRDDLLPQAS